MTNRINPRLKPLILAAMFLAGLSMGADGRIEEEKQLIHRGIVNYMHISV